MLAVQKYLKSGKTPEDLESELDVKANWHPTLPIFKLNYGLASPKLNDVVRDCRSLTLDKNFDLISRAFPRFFNLHEVPEINDQFRWSDFSTYAKEDGWLCVVFYYNNQWIISSRSSFGDNIINNTDLQFKDVFFRGVDQSRLNLLDKKISYVFEVCSKYTKIVRQYNGVQCFLLAAYRGEEELSNSYCDNVARILDVPRPFEFTFKSAHEVYKFIQTQEKHDKTFEGVVLKDSNNLRIKVKSSTYVALHRLRGEGDNLISPKYIVPLVLNGEMDEVLTYWSEYTEDFHKVKEEIDLHEKKICDLWDRVQHIEDQKEFALSILDKTPFCGLLFTARKVGKHPKEIFRESPDMIYKVLYK